MKTKYELDKDDIRHAIQYYVEKEHGVKVKLEEVILTVGEEWHGQGMMEEKIHVPRATVTASS